MVSYCHRHCRVDTERAALWVGEDGLSIGKHGALSRARRITPRSSPRGRGKSWRRTSDAPSARRRRENERRTTRWTNPRTSGARRGVADTFPRVTRGPRLARRPSSPRRGRPCADSCSTVSAAAAAVPTGAGASARRGCSARIAPSGVACRRRTRRGVFQSRRGAVDGETSGHPRINTCEVRKSSRTTTSTRASPWATIVPSTTTMISIHRSSSPIPTTGTPPPRRTTDDDSDDADDDDDSGDGDADAAAAMEPDAPPGGWDAFELDDDAAGAVTMMDASTEELFGEDTVVARPEARRRTPRRANELPEEDIQPANARAPRNRRRRKPRRTRESLARSRSRRRRRRRRSRAQRTSGRRSTKARTEEPAELEAEDDGVKEDGDSGDDDEDEDGADQGTTRTRTGTRTRRRRRNPPQTCPLRFPRRLPRRCPIFPT